MSGTLVSNIKDVLGRISTEFRDLRTLISGSATGNVSGLQTSAMNLVDAINEVKNSVGAIAPGAAIEDAAISLTSTWSSSKISGEIQDAVDGVLGGAPEALNTLNELSAALGNDANAMATLTTLIGSKADAADVYTKAAADSLLDGKLSVGDVYSNVDIDGFLSSKAAVGDSYLKAETYSAAAIDALLANVPVAGDYFTKPEVLSYIQNLNQFDAGLVMMLGGSDFANENLVTHFESALNA